MRATVDLSLFLPSLESGVDIVTPGKRLARSQRVGLGIVVIRIQSWPHRRWQRLIAGWSGRGRALLRLVDLPPMRLLTPQQDLTSGRTHRDV